MKPVCLLII